MSKSGKLEQSFESDKDEFTQQALNFKKNYKITKELGQGTFGKVSLGIHLLSNQQVAIKVIEKNKIHQKQELERIAREIHILKILRHPNIIQLYDIYETETQTFLIMEICSKGELYEYIVQNKFLLEQEAKQLYLQLLSSIEYIHSLNICHRDLKPENLLLDSKLNIKLIDFGLSNLYRKNKLLQTACGSPCYAAPEMIAGKKYDPIMVDVWSSGIVLYAMLCGFLPFDDADTNKLYKKIMRGIFNVPDFISVFAKDLIQKILVTDPQNRISIKEIQSHPWFNSIRFQQKGIIVNYHEIPIDKEIINTINDMGLCSSKELKKQIRNNHHNNIITYYYLLLKQKIQIQFSIADISQPTYIPKLKNKFETQQHDDKRAKSTFKNISKKSTSLKLHLRNITQDREEEDQSSLKRELIIQKKHKSIINRLKTKKITQLNTKSITPNHPDSDSRTSDLNSISIKKKQMLSQNIYKNMIKPKIKEKVIKNLQDTNKFDTLMPLLINIKDQRVNSLKMMNLQAPEKLISLNSYKIKSSRNRKSTTPQQSPISQHFTDYSSKNSDNEKSSSQNKNTFRSMQKSKPKIKIQNLEEISMYKGPINLQALSNQNPQELFQNIIDFCDEEGINYSNTDPFVLKCKKNGNKFVIQIQILENFKQVYCFTTYCPRNIVDNPFYYEICQKLYSLITFI